MIRTLLGDLLLGAFSLAVALAIPLGLGWLWQHGCRWPAYLAMGVFGLFGLILIGAWLRRDSE